MTTPRAPRTADIVGHACGGTHTGGRRTRDLDWHPITLDSGALVVDVVGTRLRADADASAWTHAEVVVGG